MGVRVTQTESSVVIGLGPIRSLLSLKRRLEIPRSRIRSIEVIERSRIPVTEGTWLRAPGTHVPGLIRLGSYGRQPLREFWQVLREKRVVIISIADWAYHRVVIGAGDPEKLAADLERSWQQPG